MEPPRYVEADCRFALGGHRVGVRVTPRALGVQVEAHGTGQRWGGDFDSAYIEDLTRKTGNFKRFGIFCAMMEAALTGASAAVRLQLLTFADLQRLRGGRKLGGLGGHWEGLGGRGHKLGGSPVPPVPPPSPPQSPPGPPSPLSSRRYLILLYRAQFDRIHYPLPLPPLGWADPAELHRELQRERAQRRLLLAQLEQAQAAERRLQLRVQLLTAEVAALRGGSAAPPHPPRERRGGHNRGRPPATSPSPTGPRPPPRFDPTAFVRARQRRQKELELKNQRRGATLASASPVRRSRGRSSSAESFQSRRSALSSGSEANEPVPPSRRRGATLASASPVRRSRGRSSSAESFQSRRSALSSGSEANEPVPPRGRTRSRRPPSASSFNSPSTAPPPHKPCVANAATKRPSKENPSKELAEIDTRLQVLQEYMDRIM